MVMRNKSGKFSVSNSAVLLDFLGVKTNEQVAMGNEQLGKRITVNTDVELIAPVPFKLVMSNEELAMEEGERSGISWTLSTFDLDRFGERIDPAGWDYRRYRENPVVEWAHRYDIPAIGKAEGLYADENGLHGSVVFNDKDYDPFGWAIGQRVQAGVIRAGSVGFRVIEIEIPDKETAKDGTTLIFRKQELLEFSICNVPANPYALAKMSNEELGVRDEELEMSNEELKSKNEKVKAGIWELLLMKNEE
jgi:HK97 family phage prohead protease